MLRRDEININNLGIFENHVEKPDQHILVRLASEQPLEHEVTQQFRILLSTPSF